MPDGAHVDEEPDEPPAEEELERDEARPQLDYAWANRRKGSDIVRDQRRIGRG